jgi:AhpD family alkylhydroperoxidase
MDFVHHNDNLTSASQADTLCKESLRPLRENFRTLNNIAGIRGTQNPPLYQVKGFSMEMIIYLPATFLLKVRKVCLISIIFKRTPYMSLVENFNSYRSKMNEKILDSDSLIIKRIFNLDTNAYADSGSLDVRSKELIGLTCSLVLRCDDCVKYHLGKCKETGLSTSEVNEAMGIATLIGGTIVIPHLRRAFEYWEELQNV